jgi:hypothetical protein
MGPLSSSAAIPPALRRMRNVFLRPFAAGPFFRCALAAVIAESVVLNFRYVTPHLDFGEVSAGVQGAAAGSLHRSASIVLLGIAGLVLVDVVLLAWYAIVRLRFTVFHAVLCESPGLREGWRRYAKPADRLFRATLLATLANLTLVGVLAGFIALGANTVINVRTPDGKYDLGVFLLMFFPTIAFAGTIVLVFVLTHVVFHDFILPHVALENCTAREAWRVVRKRIRAEREAFFSYFLLRVLFAIVAGPVLWVIGFAILWPVSWMLGTSAAGYNALLADATGWSEVFRIALNVVMLMLGAALGAAGAAMFGGPMAVFLRAHAMYFYGSRYKALGELLEPRVTVEVAGGDSSQ